MVILMTHIIKQLCPYKSCAEARSFSSQYLGQPWLDQWGMYPHYTMHLNILSLVSFGNNNPFCTRIPQDWFLAQFLQAVGQCCSWGFWFHSRSIYCEHRGARRGVSWWLQPLVLKSLKNITLSEVSDIHIYIFIYHRKRLVKWINDSLLEWHIILSTYIIHILCS